MSRLHWYGPRSYSRYQAGITPLKRARQKLYIAKEHYYPDSSKYGKDRYGYYVWVGTDCGWEWLETRPGLRRIFVWRWLFGKLCDHVHTPGSW